MKNIPIEIHLDSKYQHDALGFHKRVSDKHLRTDIGANTFISNPPVG